MNSKIEPLYKEAKAAIERVFSTLKVSRRVILNALEALDADLDGYMDSTQDDINQEEEGDID